MSAAHRTVAATNSPAHNGEMRVMSCREPGLEGLLPALAATETLGDRKVQRSVEGGERQ